MNRVISYYNLLTISYYLGLRFLALLPLSVYREVVQPGQTD